MFAPVWAGRVGVQRRHAEASLQEVSSAVVPGRSAVLSNSIRLTWELRKGPWSAAAHLDLCGWQPGIGICNKSPWWTFFELIWEPEHRAILIIRLHIWGMFLRVSPEGALVLGESEAAGAGLRADQQGQRGGSRLLCLVVSRLEKRSLALKPSESIKAWYKYATSTRNNSIWEWELTVSGLREEQVERRACI